MRTYQKNYRLVLTKIKKNKRNKDYPKQLKELREALGKLSNKFQYEMLSSIDITINTKSKFLVAIANFINTKCLEMFKKANKNIKSENVQYWQIRGWGIEDSLFFSKKVKSLKPKRLSPFNYKFWVINHNMSKEEALNKVNSFKPTKNEHWINKGYTDKEARQKVIEFQINNALKYKKKKDKNPDRYKDILPNQLGYWIKQGFNEADAKQKLKERQTTFSLEKCIERHGNEKGTKVFNERQRKWQKTLNNKTQEEKEDINRRKNNYYRFKNESIDDYADRVLAKLKQKYLKESLTKNYPLNEKLLRSYDSKELFLEHNLEKYKNSVITKAFYLPEEVLTDNSVILKELFGIKYLIREFNKFYEPSAMLRTGYGIHRRVDEGLLRSNIEFKFYNILKENNIEFELERYYFNSKMNCDFFLVNTGEYIEVAGRMADKEYKEKMMFKQEKFNAIILEAKDFNNFKKERNWK